MERKEEKGEWIISRLLHRGGEKGRSERGEAGFKFPQIIGQGFGNPSGIIGTHVAPAP